jgi:hypothetical protein
MDPAEVVEQLTWEGIIGAPTALAMWIVFAIIAAWALWRERAAVGRGWATTFWLLRCAAFACALWMLAGPTRERTERTTTKQSIAIFADRSDSMEVVDAPDASDSLRWALAIDGDAEESPVVLCDRLSVALGVALADCQRFESDLAEHRAASQLATSMKSIETAVERASQHADALVESLDDNEGLLERASRIAAVIQGTVGEGLAANRKAIANSKHAATDEVAGRHEQVVEGIAAARRRALSLAANLVERQSSGGAQSTAETDAMTRREKAVRTLDALEDSIGERKDELRIQRYSFDRAATPVSIDSGWKQALAALPIDAGDGTAEEIEPAADTEESEGQPADFGPTTNLSSVFEQINTHRSGEKLRLAVLLSDGRHNDSQAAAPQEIATQLANVPVFVVPIGNATVQRDVLLHRVEAPSAVAEKDSAVIDVIVTGFDCEGQSTVAVLRHEGREVDRKPIDFSGTRSDSRVRFMVPTKEPGWQEYVVEVEPVEDEENTSNNFQPVSFEVVRDKIRVLLADSVARWEYRYLNQLFRRDEHVEFDELLFFPRLHGSGSLADRPEFPRDVDGWAKYDVVILGDNSPQQLSAESQSSLVEFVRARGGHLILIAGQNAMPGAFEGRPLAELLPVERSPNIIAQQGHRLRLTEEGRLNSALLIEDSATDSRESWRKIYDRFPVYGLSAYSRPKATARTLIEATSEPAGTVRVDEGTGQVEHAFLCWQRIGAGRVAYLAAPDTYRLRWRRGDRMHHRFWGQFMRWITAADTGVGSEIVRLQTDRTRYTAGEPVEVTVWIKDVDGRPIAEESIAAEARTFSDEAITINLTSDPEVAGRYYGTFNDLMAGAYKIGVRGAIVEKLLPAADADQSLATITVRGAEGVEMMNTQCNRALLEQVAQVTGGQVIPPTAIGEVLELMSFTPDVVNKVERTPLWNRWSSLLIVLGCLFTEWVVRKSKGLV